MKIRADRRPQQEAGEKSGLKISAVLPCYEEAPHLPGVIDGVEAALRASSPGGWEILLVCSRRARDGSLELARKLDGERPSLRLIEQAADDPGYGRALALGVAAAKHP